MIIFYNYPKDIYPGNTNPCPDFWELQMDGTCKIHDSNIGQLQRNTMSYWTADNKYYKKNDKDIETTATDSPLHIVNIQGFSLDQIPFGYNIAENANSVDFTNVNWSTYGGATSRNCALKAWANKNGVVWDGIHNYNKCQ
jgi:hypothetical protein